MRASSRFSSKSILRCASILPAWAFVVPRAEKKILGEGVMEERREDQVFVSSDMRGWSLGEEVAAGSWGLRREREWMVEMEGCESSVLRIWEPTRPVLPTIEVEVIVSASCR